MPELDEFSKAHSRAIGLNRGAPDEPSVRRVDGPTPHGGAYMVIGEYTENGVRRVEITEFDDKGTPMFRTYGTAG